MNLMLPIESHLPHLIGQVRQHPVTLLEATPGSGKTTLVPLALLRAFSGKILVLEPRRLAAKMAARRVSDLLNEEVGQTVGYIYRNEQKTSPQTRLLFLTEGTFLRYLQGNPELEGVDVVVLDEFHERHLTTDLAFGLLQRLSPQWPKAPRLIIMSATLDDTPLRQHYPALEKIKVETPIFPLELRYPPRDGEWSRRPLERKVLWGVQEALALEGDILVFLPGMGEIRRVEKILLERLADAPIRVLILHGQEASSERDIMGPLPERKIILATNVAESSLTIPGVRVVIDGGLNREAVFSPWSGFTELITGPCSQASAIQRAGRAARMAPGICLRLYAENDFAARPVFTTPEILKTDLAHVLLDLALWELTSQNFPWPSAPPASSLEHARGLLRQLHALTDSDGITNIGRAMAQLPIPPRAARVVVEAQLQGTPEALRETCRLLAEWLEPGEGRRKLEEQLRTRSPARGQETSVEKFFLAGFPDRIAKARGDDVVTVEGETFKLAPEVRGTWDPRHPFWLVLDVNGLHKSATRLLPLEEAWVRTLSIEEESTFFDEDRQRMVRRTQRRLGVLVFDIKDEAQLGSAGGEKALASSAREWLDEFRQGPAFVRWELFARTFFPDKSLSEFEWELFLEEFLLEEKLPTDAVKTEFEQKLAQELQLYFDSSFQKRLSDHFPTRFSLHEKRGCEVHYEMGKPPWIEAHIQDFFGRTTQPALANGLIPLTVHLLGPHGRAEQITGDLAGFWQNTYPTLAKEMRREYPRHFWPEDPRTAEPMLRLPRRPR